jgi:HD-like signal output (HDOD) protein
MPPSSASADKSSDRLQLPLLTPTAQRMLSAADEAVRQNVAFLELVAVKDPVAVSKLLALANSAFVTRPRPTQRVREAIVVLGTDVSFDVLLQSALLASLLSQSSSLDPVLTSFLRKYMLSMTMTMRQLRKSVSLTFKPSSETVATFSALGIVASLTLSPVEQEPLEELAVCASKGEFRLHSRPALREWLDRTAEVLHHWRFDPDSAAQVAGMTKELYDVYDGTVDGETMSLEGALAMSAQWLLSTDFSHMESDKEWLALPCARRCGFDKTNIAPSSLRMLVK